MKLKNGFVKRKMADCYVLVPLEDRIIDFKGMLTLNETGAFLIDKLIEGTTVDAMLDGLINEYDIDNETAMKDIENFLEIVNRENLLEEE